ncbi:MAG: hypothetical protein R2737_01285 [Candidatus Nanopelagicales bacterium]
MASLRLLPDLEESLRLIPGVRAASVVTGPDARPTEVHVLATPGKPAKQVVRDVQAVALARHNLDIDHRIVSVVQIDDPLLPGEPTTTPAAYAPGANANGTHGTGSNGPGAAHPGGEANTLVDASATDAARASAGSMTGESDRPAQMSPVAEAAGGPTRDTRDEPPTRAALTSITTSRAGGTSKITVVLGIEGATYTGSAAGPGSPTMRPRLVAEATLAALDELLGIPAAVTSAQLVTTGGDTIALSVLRLDIPRVGEHITSGSAVVRADPEDAVARSVLAAVNRRLSG